MSHIETGFRLFGTINFNITYTYNLLKNKIVKMFYGAFSLFCIFILGVIKISSIRPFIYNLNTPRRLTLNYIINKFNHL